MVGESRQDMPIGQVVGYRRCGATVKPRRSFLARCLLYADAVVITGDRWESRPDQVQARRHAWA
jgi:hypothetical protein